MALLDDLKKTGRKGVFYKEHPTRKHGPKKDRLLVLRYTINKKTKTETFGWTSNGATELKAESKIIEFRENFKLGSGTTSLAEENEIAQKNKRDEDAKRRMEITVGELATEYIERHAKRKKKSWKEDLRMLNKDIVPVWDDWCAKDITRRDAAALIEDIVQRGAPVQSKRVMSLASKMFNLAIDWGYCDLNPFERMSSPVKEQPRVNVLDTEELKIFWHVLDDFNTNICMSVEMRKLLKLILVTGQRPGEVAGMHRREIDGRWWTIPTERTKNKKGPHRVYLSDLALEIVGNSQGYIFSGKMDSPIVVCSISQSLRRNILGESNGKKPKGLSGRNKKQAQKKIESTKTINRFGIKYFRPHDLRRTAYTGMAALKVPYEHRERVVNHTLGKLDETYNQHDFDNEKMRALTLWSQKLENLIAGNDSAKVVNLFPDVAEG